MERSTLDQKFSGSVPALGKKLNSAFAPGGYRPPPVFSSRAAISASMYVHGLMGL